MLALLACEPPAPPARPRAPELAAASFASTAVPAPVVPALPASASAASAAPSATPSDPDPPEPIYARAGTPGSSRGTIACGSVRCKARTEACFFDEAKRAWGCGRVGAIDARPELTMDCDDASDCGAAQICCRSYVSAFAAQCAPRSRLERDCVDELCDVDGPPCPRGRTCVARSPGAQATCEAPAGPATCAGGKKCPADAPMCVDDHGRIACAAKGSPAYMAVDIPHRWQCTRQDDCHAGEVCSYTYFEFNRPDDHGTSCARLTPGITGTLVCDPRPRVPGGRPPGRCAVRAGPVPWMGSWN